MTTQNQSNLIATENSTDATFLEADGKNQNIQAIPIAMEKDRFFSLWLGDKNRPVPVTFYAPWFPAASNPTPENCIRTDFVQSVAPSLRECQWQQYQLTNGGYFIAPVYVGKAEVEFRYGKPKLILSDEAAGIVFCYYLLYQFVSWDADDHISNMLSALLEYAEQHPEIIEISHSYD